MICQRLLRARPTRNFAVFSAVFCFQRTMFSRTIVFVSHDRYFIDKLATRVFEVGEAAVHVFPGNYEDYVWRKEGGAAAGEPQPAAAPPPSEGHAVRNAPAPAPVKAVVERRLNPLKLKQMRQ